MLAHLERILPAAKQHFDHAYISISSPTLARQDGRLAALLADPFFSTTHNGSDSQVGDHFVAAFRLAVTHAPAGHILHLCSQDRLAYGLLSEHCAAFLADLEALDADDLPLIFARSPLAWSTHPRNYWAAEATATTAGEILFGRNIDFFWCHLTITAGQLGAVLPRLRRHDLCVVTELALYLTKTVTMKAVDWLSWEDPFILDRDPAGLKFEREHDSGETAKRLGYVLPGIQLLLQHYEERVT